MASLFPTADGTGPTADSNYFTLDAETLAGPQPLPPGTLVTVDSDRVTVDYTGVTVDQGRPGGIPTGWPCALLPSDAPSIRDRQSDASADDYLQQILTLTPRGPAWGTDEVGDGRGASPIQRLFWKAIAFWTADVNARDFEASAQTFPTAITYSLETWENELGLPDDCFVGGSGADARVAAVRARFGALGGQSPAYFICLARSIGYDITIDEPTQFLIDTSEVGPDPIREDWFRIDEGEVAPDSQGESWFLIDESECAPASILGGVLQPEGDGDPLEGFAFSQEGDGTRLESFTATGLDEDLDEVADEGVWKYWVVNAAALGESYFRIDDGEIAYTPLEGFQTREDLECLLQRYAPAHTRLIFSYAL